MKTLTLKFAGIFALLITLTFAIIASAFAAPNSGGTFTVNSAADNTTKDSVLTLHEAALIANGGTGSQGLFRTLTNPEGAQLSGCVFGGGENSLTITSGCGIGVTDTIHFKIPGSGVHTIHLSDILTAFAEPIVIDGFSQPGSSPNTSKKGDNAVRLIVVNGNGHQALFLTSGNSTVQGLEITNTYLGIIADGGGNVIQGNYIHDGDSSGVSLSQGDYNLIGGATLAARNIISGYEDGIQVEDTSGGNTIQGNLIGTDRSGKHAHGNGRYGILILSSRNLVGGGAGNVIAFNARDGVSVGYGGYRNIIFANSFFSNNELGIDLGSDGVTPNNSGIAENQGQNYPGLLKATSATSKIKGKLVGAPSASYAVEFFTSTKCDASGFGEGKKYLGNTIVTADANGIAVFNVKVKKFPAGKPITATARDYYGNTSEFSKCKNAE